MQPPYLFFVDLGAADQDEAGVDDVLVDDQQQEVEAMEAVLLPVTQELAMASTGTKNISHQRGIIRLPCLRIYRRSFYMYHGAIVGCKVLIKKTSAYRLLH